MDKISKALSQGKLKGAKQLATNLLQSEHKASWNAERQAEYNSLFPATREMTSSEMLEHDERFTDESPKPEDYLYPLVDIEYISEQDGEEVRDPSWYRTYSEWLSETTVKDEAVYYTYEEYLETIVEGETATPEQYWEATIKTPEVTELVRPYVPLDVTDEMILAKLDLYSEYGSYKLEVKNTAKEAVTVTYNDVSYQGDPMSINFMSAVGAIGAMRMYQTLVQNNVITQEQYDMVYKTKELWKGSDNVIHEVTIEEIVDASELAMQEQAKAIGVK